MNDTEPTSSGSPAPRAALPEGRLEGRGLFADLVRQAFAAAAQEGWPRMLLCDADFADWPLGEREVVESLHAWSARGRTMQLLARDFTPLRERHPRFVQWRVTWSHLVEAHACVHAPAADLPSVLWSPAWSLHRIDPLHGTMVASRRADQRVALQEALQGWWQKGSPAFPASTLGL